MNKEALAKRDAKRLYEDIEARLDDYTDQEIKKRAAYMEFELIGVRHRAEIAGNQYREIVRQLEIERDKLKEENKKLQAPTD